MSPTDVSTIPRRFAWRASQNPDAVALKYKRAGEFQPVTWRQLQQQVWRAADVLAGLGVKPGDRVVQSSGNRYEWIVADLAILSIGAVHVPLHSTLNRAQQLEQATDSQPCCLIEESPDALELPDLPVLSFHPQPAAGIQSWSAALESADLDRGRQLVQLTLPDIQADCLATILYTSGTTGESKGVMLSHGNVTSNAVATSEVFSVGEGKVRLNFLPLSHIFARGCDIYGWLASGCLLVLAESKETVVADCRASGPHFLAGVPYFFERVVRTLQSVGVADKPGVLKKTLGATSSCAAPAGLPWRMKPLTILTAKASPSCKVTV